MPGTKTFTIDAEVGGKKLHYRELNAKIRKAVKDGYDHITLLNVSGQRFIGAGLKGDITIDVYGDAGLDTGCGASQSTGDHQCLDGVGQGGNQLQLYD